MLINSSSCGQLNLLHLICVTFLMLPIEVVLLLHFSVDFDKFCRLMDELVQVEAATPFDTNSIL